MKIHIVQKGDTLWEIAEKYGVDFEEVKHLNSQLSSPDMIMPGMKVKIPSSTKPVKKESVNKETQKEQTLKGVSPKPLSTIKEDDMKKPKEVKMEMPIHLMPQAAPMPPMMQMPVMEQEMQSHTTINLPEFLHYEKLKEKPKEKPMQEMPQMPQHQMPQMEPMPQMPQQQMPQMKPMPQMPQDQMPMVPMCCHYIQPCCHHMHHPGLKNMGMHKHPMHSGKVSNCGCQSQSPFPHQHMRHPIPASGFDPVEFKQENLQFSHMVEPNKHTPQFSHEPFAHSYPTPPDYATYSGATDQEDDS